MRLPRPTFRLRTLLVAIAVLALPLAWVAYSLSWVRQRRCALTELERYGMMLAPADYEFTAPGLLWIFGETGVPRLYEDLFTEETDMAALQRLFPEAKIITR